MGCSDMERRAADFDKEGVLELLSSGEEPSGEAALAAASAGAFECLGELVRWGCPVDASVLAAAAGSPGASPSDLSELLANGSWSPSDLSWAADAAEAAGNGDAVAFLRRSAGWA